MSLISGFVDKARSELHSRPVLPWGAPLTLGAIGVVKDNQYEPRGNVQSVLGSEVGDVATGERANWQFSSGSGVQLKFLASGNASTLFPEAPKISARVELSFSSSDSFFVSVEGLEVSTMADPSTLLQKMLEAHDRGTWRKEFVLIYEVVVPTNSLVLVARSANSRFLLTAKANVQVPQGAANVAANFDLTYQSQDALHLDSRDQPLFFNAYRVKDNFWTGEGVIERLGKGKAVSVLEQV